MLLACLVAIACAACNAADTPPGAAVASSGPGRAQPVDALPLQPGYYVSTDTRCEEASNATLHVMNAEGDGYGGFTTPPYFCTFDKVEQVGPSLYRVTETCQGSHGEGGADTSGALYEIIDRTSYRAERESGWQNSARRCPRAQLPALWREEDIGSFVD